MRLQHLLAVMALLCAPTLAIPGNAPEIVIVVHGSLASMAFLALFPLGAILLRVPGLPGAVWIHAGVQVLAYISFIVAVGMGVVIATIQEEFRPAHPIIGLVLFSVLLFQPISGMLHHNLFKKHGKRTLGSWIHVWVGRLAVLLGMINGGLGLKLVGQESFHPGYVDAYIIVAAVMGTAFVANMVFSDYKRSRDKPSVEAGQLEDAKDIQTDSPTDSPIDGPKAEL